MPMYRPPRQEELVSGRTKRPYEGATSQTGPKSNAGKARRNPKLAPDSEITDLTFKSLTCKPCLGTQVRAEHPRIHFGLPELFSSSFNKATNAFVFDLLPLTNLEKAAKTAANSLRDI